MAAQATQEHAHFDYLGLLGKLISALLVALGGTTLAKELIARTCVRLSSLPEWYRKRGNIRRGEIESLEERIQLQHERLHGRLDAQDEQMLEIKDSLAELLRRTHAAHNTPGGGQ